MVATGIIIRELSLVDHTEKCSKCDQDATHYLIRKNDIFNYNISPCFLCTRHSFEARADRINLSDEMMLVKYPREVS